MDLDRPLALKKVDAEMSTEQDISGFGNDFNDASETNAEVLKLNAPG